jgi:hypothetical protein
MLRLKPSSAILEQIPYILLVPIHDPENNELILAGLNEFLKDNYQVNHVATQCAAQIEIEEQDFIVAVKQNIGSDYFCALKVFFKSCLNSDFDKEIQVIFSLINKYHLEIFDGKTHQHLSYTRRQLREHIYEVYSEKKNEFLQNLHPTYLLN